MNREEYKCDDVQIDLLICCAFQRMLSEEEYRLSHAMAQELYNRICKVLLLVPTIIMGE